MGLNTIRDLCGDDSCRPSGTAGLWAGLAGAFDAERYSDQPDGGGAAGWIGAIVLRSFEWQPVGDHAAPSGAAGFVVGSDPRVSPVATFITALREAPAVRAEHIGPL
jgi:hypothetical protein